MQRKKLEAERVQKIKNEMKHARLPLSMYLRARGVKLVWANYMLSLKGAEVKLEFL